MTSTLSGYLVYRLQWEIFKRTNIRLSYQDLIESLTKSLLELESDMKENERIDLPTGRYFIISKRMK